MISQSWTSLGAMNVSSGIYPFRFGVALPTSGPFGEPTTIFEFAQAAENLGFDDVWINDHLNFDWDQRSTSPVGAIDAVKDQEPNFYESLTTAAAILGRLQKIGLAIGGLALPLRDPRMLAKQVTSLHELTGRRLTIGAGIGMIRRSFDIMQIPFQERGRIFDEYLAALHRLCFAAAPTTFVGERVQFTNANFYPHAIGLRLLVAGEGDRALARAAKWGHGWLTSYPDPGSYGEKIRSFRNLASAGGRDPDQLDTVALVFVCLASSYGRAVEICGPTLVSKFGDLDRACNVSVIGTVPDAIQAFTAMYGAGMRYLHLRPITRDRMEWHDMMNIISESVIPAVLGSIN